MVQVYSNLSDNLDGSFGPEDLYVKFLDGALKLQVIIYKNNVNAGIEGPFQTIREHPSFKGSSKYL